MRRILNHGDLRDLRDLPFCYGCGKPFSASSPSTRDHVPPKSIFASASLQDRPLILLAHGACNNASSKTDEVVGQLFSLTHDQDRDRTKLDKHTAPIINTRTGDVVQAVWRVDLKRVIWRWIRAFHAALYSEYLPDRDQFSLLEPLPGADESGGGFVPTPILSQYEHISHLIKQNRAADQFDAVRVYGNKLRYECAWGKAETGQCLCFFALDIDNWRQLGDPNLAPRRGCVGHYVHGALPAEATLITATEPISVKNDDPLDPFED